MEFPKPTVDPVNRAMLTAWSERGELLLQHCMKCDHTFFYPRKRCPSCWAAELENRASDGKGEIVTFSLIHRGVDEAFRKQASVVAMAVVKTAEGPQIITRIVTDQLSQIEIGQAVSLYRGKDRSTYPLPVYSLGAAAGA